MIKRKALKAVYNYDNGTEHKSFFSYSEACLCPVVTKHLHYPNFGFSCVTLQNHIHDHVHEG